MIWLGSIQLAEETCLALIGLHAFSGNDYNSSFFRKGKEKHWNLMRKNSKFMTAFQTLGSSLQLSDTILEDLEEFVCHLYGWKVKNLNEARWKAFRSKVNKEHKVTDIALLPPCRQVFHYHTERSNYISYVWKNSRNPIIDLPPIQEHGWFEDGEIFWMDEAFPNEIDFILEENANNSDYENQDFGSDVESNDEEEDV